MAVSIRTMQEADIADVRRVARTTWHATYAGVIPEPVRTRFLDAFYSDEALKRRMGGSLLLVAESERGIVGFANFFESRRDPEEAELGAIYIMPDAQRTGVGSMLLAEGIGRLAGTKRLFVNVERSNRNGRAFYDARKFRIVGETQELFYGHALTTVKMRLDLACRDAE
ncbi:GNAT family N-acetyltransferase [Paenibacillus flagellatus]|uniref:GNAT family N-acetyltransferase n=1 Tax=Paenibacillus flagellatus TaxID=2211139 RepID=A0A2V5KE17_9BACL|nr:GNAT family N-acetyltransferase [Paenibacillus flagellatus]PYI57272.1 GNAT family N-acetyltransferase [Paenibacillus flagellatus]